MILPSLLTFFFSPSILVTNPSNISAYGSLLFLLDDLPDNVKTVMGDYLERVAKSYLVKYNEGLWSLETPSVSEDEDCLEELNPRGSERMAELAEENSQAGTGRVIDLHAKITDGYERWRANCEQEEAEAEVEDSNPEDDGDSKVSPSSSSSEENEKEIEYLIQVEKLKAFYQRIGLDFNDTLNSPPRPLPSAKSPTISPWSSPSPTVTTKEKITSGVEQSPPKQAPELSACPLIQLAQTENQGLLPSPKSTPLETKPKMILPESFKIDPILSSPEFASFFGDLVMF